MKKGIFTIFHDTVPLCEYIQCPIVSGSTNITFPKTEVPDYVPHVRARAHPPSLRPFTPPPPRAIADG